MKYSTHSIVFPILLVALLSQSCSKQDYTTNPQQAFSVVLATDPEMAAAIANARASLPQFWQVFEHPLHGETNFALKVRISDTNDTEYVWLDRIERKDGSVYGSVGGGKLTIRCIKPGDRVTIAETDIGDWSYELGGKEFGNYTIRALFKTMPAKDVDHFKKILATP
jgi:uncharacterized protein YegJ (DUF2314 family)